MNLLEKLFTSQQYTLEIGHPFQLVEDRTSAEALLKKKAAYLYCVGINAIVGPEEQWGLFQERIALSDCKDNVLFVGDVKEVRSHSASYKYLVYKDRVMDMSKLAEYEAMIDYFRQDFLGEILDKLHDAVCIINVDKEVLFWNKRAELIYNTPREEILGKPIDQLFPKALLPKVIEKQVAYGNVFNNPREEFKNMITASPLLYEGQLLGAISCDTDVSELINTTALLKSFSEKEPTIKALEGPYQMTFSHILGQEALFVETKEFAKKIADSNINVLITGESGTGKELFAQAIHHESKRTGPFVPVNCSAIPPELMESELFGYERGSFTGANREGKPGLLEVADHGTILLDEIGDLPLSMQPKILRFLEDGILYRIGGKAPIQVDVRVIASTNHNLKSLIKEKRFRTDLYYRLNSVHLELPPLRERKEDIPLLVNKFIKDFSTLYKTSPLKVSDEIMKSLQSEEWEGNIRELRNIIERMVILEKNGHPVKPLILNVTNLEVEPIEEADMSLEDQLHHFERALIEKAIKRANHNKSKAASLLGIPRTTLLYKMDKLSVE